LRRGLEGADKLPHGPARGHGITLGEMSDYIPEIVFTSVIVDRAAARERRHEIVAFLRGLIEATRWVYDPANDEALLEMTMELTGAEGKYGWQAFDYMRASGSSPPTSPSAIRPSRNRGVEEGVAAERVGVPDVDNGASQRLAVYLADPAVHGQYVARRCHRRGVLPFESDAPAM
jgi:hypothetical protein